MTTYRPLPKGLTIAPSMIDGLGLFATENIADNTELGITHIYSSVMGDWIRTPLGGFYNHSDNPNCKTVEDEEFYGMRLFTIRDIKAGEELTAKYTLYEV